MSESDKLFSEDMAGLHPAARERIAAKHLLDNAIRGGEAQGEDIKPESPDQIALPRDRETN